MPLLDHFRPPLSELRHWHSFHNSWATYLSSSLNSLLPEGYFAEINVQFRNEHKLNNVFQVSTPPLDLPDSVVEIGVFNESEDPQLAGAIELVSPANKDRPSHRDALVSKCATYIQAGVGLVLIDVVTERYADWRRELSARLGLDDPAPGAALSGSAYRCLKRDGVQVLDVWHEPITLGEPLPTLPLWLRGGLCLPVDFEATYQRTCIEQRIHNPPLKLIR